MQMQMQMQTLDDEIAGSKSPDPNVLNLPTEVERPPPRYVPKTKKGIIMQKCMKDLLSRKDGNRNPRAIFDPDRLTVPKSRRWKQMKNAGVANDDVDNGSTTTNKSSVFLGKRESEGAEFQTLEAEDDCMTVIENDCDNDYSDLCRSLDVVLDDNSSKLDLY
jgi:hypothetical protein